MTTPARPDGRPEDVDTGYWLWVAALALLVAGHVADLVLARQPGLPLPVVVISVLYLVVLAAVVLTFQILMRHGYRWARTVLSGGGVASVVYAVTSLFSVDRPPTPAVIYAVTVIGGSVLVLGGVVLLHRKDAHAFFTR